MRGGGQATQSVNPYASTGEEGILGAIGLGRWGRGMTRGSSEAQNVPSGLRGPGRLIKSVADVTWESVPALYKTGSVLLPQIRYGRAPSTQRCEHNDTLRLIRSTALDRREAPCR